MRKLGIGDWLLFMGILSACQIHVFMLTKRVRALESTLITQSVGADLIAMRDRVEALEEKEMLDRRDINGLAQNALQTSKTFDEVLKTFKVMKKSLMGQ